MKKRGMIFMPNLNAVFNNEEYKLLENKASNLETELLKLFPNDKTLFFEYKSALTEAYEYAAQEAYRLGIKAAAGIL